MFLPYTENMAMKANEIRYKCSDCEKIIHPVSYRAACPECGGTLQTAQRLNDA